MIKRYMVEIGANHIHKLNCKNKATKEGYKKCKGELL